LFGERDAVTAEPQQQTLPRVLGQRLLALTRLGGDDRHHAGRERDSEVRGEARLFIGPVLSRQ